MFFQRCFTTKAKAYKGTVGLEIHAQILSKTKLFSGAETAFAAPINSCVNLFDASIPGTLPVLNKQCVELAVLTSLALKCKINKTSHFDRKHYFYADLPAGYQITQQRSPIGKNGEIDFLVYTPGVHKVPYKKTCRLQQIQLEQDSGKSLHDENLRKSFIDLNRAGVPLLEFVFEPNLADGEEAAALVKELMLILHRLKACSCKMEEGALRVDANVSVSDDGSLGVRTEIKNIGSVRAVANAISYEVNRQIEVIQSGGKVVNETRSWDPISKQTISMREKESKQDYRFMPEPNLPPLRIKIDDQDVTKPGVLDLRHLLAHVRETPEESRQKLREKYGFSEVYAIMLVGQPWLYNIFEITMDVKHERNAKLLWNILIVQLLNICYKNNVEVESCMSKADIIGNIVDLIEDNKINLEIGKNILELIIVNNSKDSPEEIIKKNNWFLVSDPEKINQICQTLIAKHPQSVKKFKKGKTKALQVLINDVVSISTEKINLSMVSKRLKELLK